MTWFVLLIALVLFAARNDDGNGEYVSCEEWPARLIGPNTYQCRCGASGKIIYTLGNRVDLSEACRFGR